MCLLIEHNRDNRKLEMLFNSYEFVFVFLPITLLVYFWLNLKRLTIAAKAWLVFASLFYYSWWNISYLPIMLISMIFNYSIGTILSGENLKQKINPKTVLSVGIVANLCLLGYFKYFDFFISNVNSLFKTNLVLLNIVLPLAISFFTFQQIAYLIDSYNKQTKEYDFLNYALFVSFFPQLIAGPIVHHKEMMPQFADVKTKILKHKNIALGVFLFSIGLFKKVMLADHLSSWVNSGYESTQYLNMIEAWVLSFSYTFQLYLDFSGYTDMAMGIAKMFNIDLPINFNSPYKAVNIQDFWRRWHITLSRFLRDYVYIPLGGNKKRGFKTYQNLITTFLLGGLWHGAGWTFILWGFLHGIALVIHRLWIKTGLKLNTFLAWFITFNFVNLTWVFFRAESFQDAFNVIKAMCGFNGITLFNFSKHYLGFLEAYNVKFGNVLSNIFGDYWTIPILFAIFIIIMYKNSTQFYKEFKPTFSRAVAIALIALVAILNLSNVKEFLYFNF
ncbi:MAG: hypothetical protein ACD_20C00413G0002 [uncultured bacterium]|nr:MAG: hypothetical protein ACD_20C00413G0002 [uncultured bacterium]